MRIISFHCHDGHVRTGVVLNDRVLDVSEWVVRLPLSEAALAHHQQAGSLPPLGGILRCLSAGPEALRQLQAHVSQCADQTQWSLRDVALYAPVPRPGKIIGVGRNYADHAKETGVAPFEKPRIIFKMPSSVAAPGAVVRRPQGAYGRDIDASTALHHVAGYTVLNDMSAREFQFDMSPAQTTFAKSMDGFCPMGPWLVTRDEVPDPQNLEVYCWLNGVQMQHGHTKDMLFTVKDLVAYVSQFMTLEPGDIITTGTPAGIGAFRTPPLYLQPGDHLEFEVTGVGKLSHSIA
jgi:2-keto-4-pentenoate hydratase/2-oxohepta-3-ene-1,7-dioic acid hydratase in catechol pathway